MLMYQSIPPAPSPPPWLRATAGHLPALSVPGVGHLQIFHCPGAGHAFASPGAIPELSNTNEVSYQNITTKRVLLEKKQIGSSVKDRNKLKRVVKACSRFYACISSLLIKPKLHSEIEDLSMWINVFWLLKLTETKIRTLKCLKWNYSTVRSMKNVAVLTEDGAFALYFRPHPGRFDSSKVPTPGNLPSKAKKCQCPGSARRGLGASGIDWRISTRSSENDNWTTLSKMISQSFSWINYGHDRKKFRVQIK